MKLYELSVDFEIQGYTYRGNVFQICWKIWLEFNSGATFRIKRIS